MLVFVFVVVVIIIVYLYFHLHLYIFFHYVSFLNVNSIQCHNTNIHFENFFFNQSVPVLSLVGCMLKIKSTSCSPDYIQLLRYLKARLAGKMQYIYIYLGLLKRKQLSKIVYYCYTS